MLSFKTKYFPFTLGKRKRITLKFANFGVLWGLTESSKRTVWNKAVQVGKFSKN